MVAAAVGSKQAMRRNGSCSPSWILAVKFQLISVLQDDFRMVGRKGGEDELPSLLSFHIVLQSFSHCTLRQLVMNHVI